MNYYENEKFINETFIIFYSIIVVLTTATIIGDCIVFHGLIPIFRSLQFT